MRNINLKIDEYRIELNTLKRMWDELDKMQNINHQGILFQIKNRIMMVQFRIKELEDEKEQYNG